MNSKRVYSVILVLLFSLSSFGDDVNNNGNASKVGIVELMYNCMDLPSGDGFILTIPGMGLIYCDEGVLVPLDTIKCPEIDNIYLKPNIIYDDIIASGKYLFVKSGNSVVKLDEDRTSSIVQFDTDFFQLYRGNDTCLNVVIPEDNGYWVWYQINLANNELESKFSTSEPIIKVIDLDDKVILVTEDVIYLYDEEQLIEYVESPEIIVDAIYTSEGLFFCTDNSLYLVDNTGVLLSLAQLPMYSLYYDYGVVYIVLQNGDIFRMAV